MKIFVAVQKYYPAVGGAEKSLKNLVDELAKNHSVTVYQAGTNNKRFKDGDVVIQNINMVSDPHCLLPIILQAVRWRQRFNLHVEAIKPDLIITQLSFAAPSIDVAREHGIKSIMFMRSYEHFCPDGFENIGNCSGHCKLCMSWVHLTHFMWFDTWKSWNIKAIQSADVVMSNSRYMSGVTFDQTGTSADVLYPSVNMGERELPESGKNARFYTIINPSHLKGELIFKKITNSMPDHQFMAVGGKVHSPGKNVVCVAPTMNMDAVYRNSRIVLVPSIWPEPFGRVPIEAGLIGVPAVASNSGGLPESVGPGGIIVEPYDIKGWIEAIRTIESDYDEYADKALRHATLFSTERAYERFLWICKNHEIDLYVKHGLVINAGNK